MWAWISGKLTQAAAAATAPTSGTPYSPPSPPDTSSSTTMSPIYPERPIRPLPKRSLRARLSPEAAETISYPPAPAPTNAVLYPSYSDVMAQRNGTVLKNAIRDIDKALIEAQDNGPAGGPRQNGYHFDGGDIPSDEGDGLGIIRRYEELQRRQGAVPRQTKPIANGVSHSCEPVSQSVASSNESVDGYDSFENTNNKKKRKIPTSGNLVGIYHPSLSAALSTELANMGISGNDPPKTQEGLDGGVGQYYGSGSSAVPATAYGTGISGAGRGRYARSLRRDQAGRVPAVTSSSGTGSNLNGRSTRTRRDFGAGASPLNTGEQLPESSSAGGIISTAIAEAATLPKQSPQSKDLSLLDQQSKKSSPSKTQFTFTCESDTSRGAAAWAGESNLLSAAQLAQTQAASTLSPSATQHQKGFSTQGTQTSPTMVGQQRQKTANNATGQQAPAPPKKPRRPASKRYAMAAAQRRVHQEYQNLHHPPKEEDIWICEFCEYESIFGSPPEALVRQYEIKDSKEQKRLAEKRRLLEKAKMKGRKNKKSSKGNAATSSSSRGNNTSSQSHQSSGQQSYQQPSQAEAVPNDYHNHDEQLQNEEQYAEDYEDDELDVPLPNLSEPQNPLFETGLQANGHPPQHNPSLGDSAKNV